MICVREMWANSACAVLLATGCLHHIVLFETEWRAAGRVLRQHCTGAARERMAAMDFMLDTFAINPTLARLLAMRLSVIWPTNMLLQLLDCSLNFDTGERFMPEPSKKMQDEVDFRKPRL